jgi:cytochrome c2
VRIHETVRTSWIRTGGAAQQRWAAVLWSVGIGVAVAIAALAQEQRGASSPQDLEAGKQVYTRKCTQCHGDDGPGTGPAANEVFPRPRDFTRGIYKIRSTPSGTVPTDDDLFRSITNGLPGTSMPGWGVLLNGIGDKPCSISRPSPRNSRRRHRPPSRFPRRVYIQR